MTVNEDYQFDVSIAMEDSKEAALKEIHLTSHNESVILNVKPNEAGNRSIVVNISEPELAGAYLTLTGDKVGDKNAFNITLRTPVDSYIIKHPLGNNYVIWHWDVVPQITGPHILTITAGLNVEVEGNGVKKSKYKRLFDDTYIKVNVKPPEPAATPAKAENVTTAAAATKAAANATKAQNATATKTPGFEGLFAVVGMIAIAHLILSRKQ
jgi:hypothetical protein